MSPTPPNSPSQFPPSDVERMEVVALLIERRRAELDTARKRGSFTPADERELFVLEDIWNRWVLEARNG